MLILFIANLFDMPAWEVTVLLQLLSDHLLKLLYSLMLLFIFGNDWFTLCSSLKACQNFFHYKWYGSQVYNYLFFSLRLRLIVSDSLDPKKKKKTEDQVSLIKNRRHADCSLQDKLTIPHLDLPRLRVLADLVQQRYPS